MSDIYVFGGNETNFTTMGLVGALTPSEAIFSEETNGASQLELTHPLDEWGRYNALVKGNVLAASVPVRMTPPIESGRIVTQLEKWVVRPGLTKNDMKVYSSADGDKALTTLKAKDKVIVIYTDPSMDRVQIKSEKGNGWISPSILTDRTSIEIEDNSNSIEDALPAWTVKRQFFRIYEVEKGLDNVRVTARHISYDLLGNITMYNPGASSAISLQTMLDGVLNNCVEPHDFSAYTNMGTTHSAYNFRLMNPMSAFLDPEQGLVKLFNCGMVRDNYELYFLNDPGLNRGVKVVYGKNMTGVTYKESHDSLVTRIIPTGKKKNGEVLYLVDNPNFISGKDWYIDSEHINEYPTPHVSRLECNDCSVSDDVTVEMCRIRMREQVENEFAAGIDEPEVTVEVEFLNLGDTAEYEQFKNLENVFLFDYVQVQYPRQNIDITARVSGISWNVLTDRMDKVTVGTIGKTLANSNINTWQIPSGIDGAKIREQTLSAATLASNSIGSTLLQNGSVTMSKLAGEVAAMLSSADSKADTANQNSENALSIANGFSSRISDLTDAVSDNSIDILGLKVRADSAESNISSLDTRVGAAETSIGSLDGKVNSIEGSLGSLSFKKGSVSVNSTSSGTIVSLDVISATGIYVLFFAYQATTADAGSAYIMRYSGTSSAPVFTLLGTLYEGSVARTPVLTSSGVIKLHGQTSDGTVRYAWMKIY